jgi:GDP-L-fucose synthase
VNVGSGVELSVAKLAGLIRTMVGYDGEIIWDRSKPDGVQRRLLGSPKINALGWSPTVELEQNLRDTYGWHLNRITADGSA